MLVMVLYYLLITTFSLVLTIPSPCPHCFAEGESRSAVTSIPHFKEVVMMIIVIEMIVVMMMMTMMMMKVMMIVMMMIMMVVMMIMVMMMMMMAMMMVVIRCDQHTSPHFNEAVIL